MLITTSTVKAPLAALRFFVEANANAGVDHLVLVFDAPGEPGQREAMAAFSDDERVTCVPTGKDWWRGSRPAGLNMRQRINANVVAEACRSVPAVSWVFHIDSDEVLLLDPDRLAAVPGDRGVLQLATWEAVSEAAPAGPTTLFKRMLTKDELALLHLLEVIPEPRNQVYFHGHIMGKAGLRPGPARHFTLHHAVDDDDQVIEGHSDPLLRVLHFDAVSSAEFARKWTSLARAGGARFRPERERLLRSVRALLALDLDGATRADYLERLYVRTTRDDVTTLSELGLLESVSVLELDHPRTGLAAADRTALAAGIRELAAGDLRRFEHDERSAPGAGEERESRRWWRR